MTDTSGTTRRLPPRAPETNSIVSIVYLCFMSFLALFTTMGLQAGPEGSGRVARGLLILLFALIFGLLPLAAQGHGELRGGVASTPRGGLYRWGAVIHVTAFAIGIATVVAASLGLCWMMVGSDLASTSFLFAKATLLALAVGIGAGWSRLYRIWTETVALARNPAPVS